MLSDTDAVSTLRRRDGSLLADEDKIIVRTMRCAAIG